MGSRGPIRVVELFAGVGGFRIGLEGNPSQPRPDFKVIWANQWEPATKSQPAVDVYASQWGLEPIEGDEFVYSNEEGDLLVNKDIAAVEASEIPDHDLLCGGFPCQDYSVAKTLKSAKGISGKKGVLWWEIRRIIEAKMPKYVLLENVDRLLKSPTNQRGRDFAVMLASLDELGYVVEWLEFSASAFGFKQRRKRVFILAYAPGTQMADELKNHKIEHERRSLLLRGFPHILGLPSSFRLRENHGDDLADVSDKFNKGDNAKSQSPFEDFGVMVDGEFVTRDAIPNSKDREKGTLRSVLQSPSKVPISFLINPDDVPSWEYLKGAKKEQRKASSGFTYNYSEGPVTFPDALDRPSRTIVTGEGGAGASRFKHVVEFTPTKSQRQELNLDGDAANRGRELIGISHSKWIRRLTPLELERLNGFPDNHTEGVGDSKRAFFMGNALICGIVERIGQEIMGVE